MPIENGTRLASIPGMLEHNVAAYNNGRNGPKYNMSYRTYIAARRGIEAVSLSVWVAGRGASAMWTLLDAFGMNARNSRLVPPEQLRAVLSDLDPAALDWIAGLALPLDSPPPELPGPDGHMNLCTALQHIYDRLASPGSVTMSGGFVAASKAMHCLFPDLAPVIDRSHAGLSFYHIQPADYTPPLCLGTWERWLGVQTRNKLNPSPQGIGGRAWGWQQFVAAMGIDQHIYELWREPRGDPGLGAFLALDATGGATGIPRLIDKGLW